jgi:hypothetical protein
MLKAGASFILNRLFFLAAIMLVLSAYAKNSCYPVDNILGKIEQPVDWVKTMAQVLK